MGRGAANTISVRFQERQRAHLFLVSGQATGRPGSSRYLFNPGAGGPQGEKYKRAASPSSDGHCYIATSSLVTYGWGGRGAESCLIWPQPQALFLAQHWGAPEWTQVVARASQGNQTEDSQGAGETALSWFAVDGSFPPGVPPCSTRRGHWEHLTERRGPKFEPLRSGPRPRLYNSGTLANGSALHPFLPALVPGKQTCPWAESLWLLRH